MSSPRNFVTLYIGSEDSNSNTPLTSNTTPINNDIPTPPTTPDAALNMDDHVHLATAITTHTPLEAGEILEAASLVDNRHNLSPQTTLNVLESHPDISAYTLRQIATGLANTALGRAFERDIMAKEVKQLREELTEECALRSQEHHNDECPTGYVENNG